MCECHQIGGPWIAEDPECPEHGWRAQARAKEAAEERDEVDERITALEQQVEEQSIMIQQLLDRLDQIEGAAQ